MTSDCPASWVDPPPDVDDIMADLTRRAEDRITNDRIKGAEGQEGGDAT